MALFEATFRQPDRVPIPGYNPDNVDDLFKLVKRAQSAQKSNAWIFGKTVKKFPWLNECLPEGTTTYVNAITAEEPEFGMIQGSGDPLKYPYFRPYGWHIDQKIFGSRLRLVVTDQPPLFASGTFQYEAEQALSNRDFTNKASDYGNNWLEQAAGLAPKQALEAKGQKHTLDSFIKEIVGLEIIPGEAGVITDGLADETLHTPTIIMSNAQTARRVIYRTQYNPA